MAPIISNDLDKYFSDVDIPDELRDDIDSLKAWLEKQPHLPKVSGEFQHKYQQTN